MKEHQIPENETNRLAALHRLNMLDTPAEERFDRITRIAKAHFGVSIALVSLVDANRQWFKSCQGIDASETPRNISFCGHAILGDKVFVVTNAAENPDFADNPLVAGPPYIRFYAGAPLHAPDGERIGTLCIIDPHPRTFSVEDCSLLRDLAGCVDTELTFTQSRERERFLKTIADAMPGLIAYWDKDLRCGFANKLYTDWFRIAPDAIIGNTMRNVLGERMFAANERKALAGETQRFERTLIHADGTPRHGWGTYIPDINAKNEVIGLFVLVTDVTALKEAENNQKDAESRLRAILDNVIDGIITIDGKGIWRVL